MRSAIAPLINAYGEAQWQSGRGVPHPDLEEAFEAIIAAALQAAPPAPAGVAVPEGVNVDAWRKGARFALEAVSKVDSICWLTDSMKEICIKQAAEAVIAERDRMAATPAQAKVSQDHFDPAQEHATQLAGQGQDNP